MNIHAIKMHIWFLKIAKLEVVKSLALKAKGS